MEEHIYTRLKVSKTHGVKLCLFCEKGVELYDKHIWSLVTGKNTFYLYRHKVVNGKQIHTLFHRELLGLQDGEIRDHWNGNGLDNRICNLRPATISENNHNQMIRKDNTSGIKGVIWYKKNQKWRAKINCNGETYQKYFADKNDAEEWVRAKREELHKDFANHGK